MPGFRRFLYPMAHRVAVKNLSPLDGVRDALVARNLLLAIRTQKDSFRVGKENRNRAIKH